VTVAGGIVAKTGRVVYHCHFLDHEGMMRPLVVMPATIRTIHSMLMNIMDDAAGTM
jgi:spore coat protein A